MSVLHQEGFAHMGGPDEFAQRYTVTGSLSIVEFNERRAGCIGANITSVSLRKNVAPSGATIIEAFAYMHLLGTAHNLLQIREGTTPHLTLRVSDDGLLSVYLGDHAGTLIATGDTGTELPEYGTAAHIEIEATIDDSAGAVIVRIDGVDVIDEDTLDTRNGGSGIIDNVLLAGSPGGAVVGDWIGIDPGDSIEPTAALGPSGRVDNLLATATAAPSQWTAIAGAKPSAIAETEQPDYDYSYIATSTDGAIDMYRVTPMRWNPADVHAVEINVVARKVSGGSTAVAMRAALPGRETAISDPVSLSGSWEYKTARFSFDEITEGDGLRQDQFNVSTFGFQAEVG